MGNFKTWSHSGFKKQMMKSSFGRKFLSTIGPRYALTKVSDLFFVLDLDDEGGVSSSIFQNGEYDRFLSKEVKKWFSPDQDIIDIGANLGYWSVFLSQLTTGMVYSFEPVPDNFDLLTKNVELNARTNIVTYQKAVGDENKSARLYQTSEYFSKFFSYELEENPLFIDVDMVRVDDLLKVMKNLGFIKLDVHGYEYFVARGLFENLKATRPQVLTKFWPGGMIQAGNLPRDYIQLFDNLGYEWKIVDQAKQRYIECEFGELMKRCGEFRYVTLLFYPV